MLAARSPSDFESLPQFDAVIDGAANPSVLAGVDGRVSSRQLVEHNLLGTINILEFCRHQNAALILLSTSRVYSIASLAALKLQLHNGAFEPDLTGDIPSGLTAAGVSESFSTAAPVSLYGATKLASEQLALEYGMAYRIPVWINRCGVMAGAGQFGRADQGIFTYWIHSWLYRRPLRYIGFGGKGYQVRDCLHPADLVMLLEQQLKPRAASFESRIVNVGGGRDSAMSLVQLSAWCRERLGDHDVTSAPESRAFDVPWLVLDCGAASRLWNWQPLRRTEDILEEILAHAREHPGWLDLSSES